MELKKLKIENGMILSKDILKNISEFSIDLVEIVNKNKSDGVISGCEITVQNGMIEVEKGIVKYNGELYFLKEKNFLDLENVEGRNIIVITFNEFVETKDFSVSSFEISIKNGYEAEENEIELGRFNLKKGAELRYEYSQMADFDTEYNIINIKNVKYSCENIKGTLHPLIMKVFAERAFAKKSIDALEASFSVEILNNLIIKRNLIEKFVMAKLKLDKKGCTNIELFEYLVKISKMDSDVRDRNDNKPFQRERIIVD